MGTKNSIERYFRRGASIKYFLFNFIWTFTLSGLIQQMTVDYYFLFLSFQENGFDILAWNVKGYFLGKMKKKEKKKKKIKMSAEIFTQHA